MWFANDQRSDKLRRSGMAETKKKMNVVQLTFMVAVNMMGSGIIMLPANMAGVGAISLTSWIVTALGSMAIGNVAIGISAVGYLATFFPGMSATPIATCISVIGVADMPGKNVAR